MNNVFELHSIRSSVNLNLIRNGYILKHIYFGHVWFASWKHLILCHDSKYNLGQSQSESTRKAFTQWGWCTLERSETIIRKQGLNVDTDVCKIWSLRDNNCYTRFISSE
jgi:hypothetical protein